MLQAWNSVGIIRCHSDDDISTIDIEFHDASLHHPLHFSNVLDHTIASLSSTAAVLACESQDEIRRYLFTSSVLSLCYFIPW